jgi:hypothetical protein
MIRLFAVHCVDILIMKLKIETLLPIGWSFAYSTVPPVHIKLRPEVYFNTRGSSGLTLKT